MQINMRALTHINKPGPGSGTNSKSSFAMPSGCSLKLVFAVTMGETRLMLILPPISVGEAPESVPDRSGVVKAKLVVLEVL